MAAKQHMLLPHFGETQQHSERTHLVVVADVVWRNLRHRVLQAQHVLVSKSSCRAACIAKPAAHALPESHLKEHVHVCREELLDLLQRVLKALHAHGPSQAHGHAGVHNGSVQGYFCDQISWRMRYNRLSCA